jgi:hypothetical protein
VADILEFLFHKNCVLNKLKIRDCRIAGDITGLLTKIVALYPDLEVLSLKDSHGRITTGYHLIPHLKKLTELNLTGSQVDMCVLNF